jgi:hypothetical protein
MTGAINLEITDYNDSFPEHNDSFPRRSASAKMRRAELHYYEGLGALGYEALGYEAAYLRVLKAVKARRSLLHGRLSDNGHTCAIGAFFADAPNAAIPIRVVEEITDYNDSFPTVTPLHRWKKVRAWLLFRTDAMRQERERYEAQLDSATAAFGVTATN